MKELIEIFPGRWIEVTRRIKKKAGVRLSAKVIATLENGQVQRAANIVSTKRKKYSRLLVEEALAMAHAVGWKAAEKKTGVHYETIAAMHRLKRGCTGKNGRRYTLAQKQACVRLAKELMSNGRTKEARAGFPWVKRIVPQWNHHTAFVEAGRRLGMNGSSIEYQWMNNMISLDVTPPAPPAPAAPVAPSILRRPLATRESLLMPLNQRPSGVPGRPKSPASAPPTGL